jgi:glycosyltransferase involved in cell wall biosynthesis
VEPLVSVVIPTYNRANEIGPTLESIIAQTYPQWEAIIVDDGSTDNTAEVVNQFIAKDARIHFIRHEHNRGGQAARNTGIKAAKGEWIAFLDSDDRWLPESLSLRLAVAEREDVSVVHSAGYLQKEGEELKPYYIPTWSGRIYHKVLTREGPMFQALLVKKEALEKIGYLDENIRAFQEWDTSIRLAKHYEFGFEPQPTFIYDLRSSDAISRDLIRGGAGYEQNIVKHRWEIIRNVGIGALSTHYDIAALWYNSGNDLKNARRSTLLALICKCLSISRVTRKVKHITGRIGVFFKVLSSRIVSTWLVVKLLPAYFVDSFTQAMRTMPKNDKRILFTFEDPNMFGKTHNDGREAYSIIKSFSDNGYNVYLQSPIDFKSYYRLREFGRLLYKINNFKFISWTPTDTKNYIYGFDTIRPDNLRSVWKKLVYINVRKANTYQIGNVIPMPFFPIPFIASSKDGDRFENNRNLIRKYKIFFGGNLNPIYYNSPLFRQRCPSYMTRLEALSSVLESDVETLFIKDAKEFNKLISNPDRLNKFVVVQTDFPFPINPKQWPSIVGQSDFFMCFSGTDYPMCHNSVEAMAVGTIPILEYADWFDPKLEHGKNAIVYSGKADMIEKIKMAMGMPEEEIQKLRKGAIEYYEQYLAKGALAMKYESNSQNISTLMLFPLFGADVWEQAQGKEFVIEFEKAMGWERKLIDKQNGPPLISVIIPTYNRAAYLEGAIRSLSNQDYQKDRYEVIIVDNDSTDNTRNVMQQIIEKFKGKLNIYYCCEKRKGIVFGRHTGAYHAKGTILLFTDDDAEFDNNWVSAVANLYMSHPEVGAAGTTIRIKWDKPPKEWVHHYEGLMGRLDWPQDIIIRRGLEIFGGSFSILKENLMETGGFNPGQIGSYLVGDCETGLCRKLDLLGIPVGLTPAATMWHIQEADINGTMKDIRRRFVNCGIGDAYYATFYNWKYRRVIKDIIIKSYKIIKDLLLVSKSLNPARIYRFIAIDSAQYQAYIKFMVIYRLNKGYIHEILSRKDWVFNDNYQAKQIEYFTRLEL